MSSEPTTAGGPEPDPGGPPPAAEEIGTPDLDDLDGAPTGADPEEAEPALDELADALRQRDDYLASLQRLQADFENFRKRVDRQQADLRDRAAESLVDKLLPVLDIADLALAHAAGAEVKQIWSALTEALEHQGLERIEGAGGPFDPTRQDAVAHEPGDGPVQEVSEVLRAGYAWKGKVLRPAMVKVRG